MKKTVIASALVLAAGTAFAQNGAPPETMWLGEFKIGGQATGIIVHDRSATARVPSAIDVPAMNAGGIPLTNFTMTDSRGAFELQGGPQLFKFDGTRSKGRVSGRVTSGSETGEFTLVQAGSNDPAANERVAGSYQVAPGHVIDIGPMDEIGGMLVFIDHQSLREGPLFPLSPTSYVSGPSIGVPYPFAVQADIVKDAKGAVTGLRWAEGGHTVTAKKIAPHRIEQVSVSNGAVTLKGSLTLPLGKGPHPAIVFAHGSGDSMRNVGIWNAFFVRQGFAVLSFDKRGVRDSSGDWHEAGMEDIAGDWLAGVDMLKGRADIDAKRIGVHGSSQGGWTGPLMAARSSDVAFVIVRAGSAVPVGQTMAYEIASSAREGGIDEAGAKEAQAAALGIFALAGGQWQQYVDYTAPLRAKPWARFVWPLNWSEKGWGKPWTARNAVYDPAETLSKVKVPVLWFLGELDHNVPVEESAQALAAARKASGNADFTVVRLADTGHSFVQTRTGNSNDFVMATHMTAGYWDKMASWMASHKFSAPGR